MKDPCTRALRILTIAALILAACPTSARPLLVAPQRVSLPPIVQPPDPGDYQTTYSGLAIDGDTLLVGASRVINTNPDRVQGVYLFERSADGSWNYVKPLVESPDASFMVNGNLATVQVSAGLLVFERGAPGWTQTASINLNRSRDHAFRLDDGAIYVGHTRDAAPPGGCIPAYEQYRKVNGNWKSVATIGGPRCDENDGIIGDINDGRAIVIRAQSPQQSSQPPPDLYADTGATSWPRVASLPAPALDHPYWYGPAVSLNGNTAYLDGNYLFRDNGGNHWTSAGHLVEPETELDIFSTNGKLRGNSLFLFGQEQDYEIPQHDDDFPSEWSTLRVYRPRANGYYDYYARLNTDYDLWTWSVSEDGKRVAALSPDNNFGGDGIATRLYVFEIPDSAIFPGTQQETFESGNFAHWTRTSGEFAVAPTATSRVLRQSSLAGDAHAYLTAIDWTDQSIEADIRPVEFGGIDRWFGLVTRRVDAKNFYYVTFRSPYTVSLRRMRDGVVTELAQDGFQPTFAPGHSYRVRLESVGDQLVAFVDGVPIVHAKDSSFTHGSPGVASYRTRFDVDNVIVSGGTRMLLRWDQDIREWSQTFGAAPSGNWQFAAVTDPGAVVLRQSDTSGDAKWFSKIAVGNQVISTRVRPMSYGTTTGTQDAWVGIAAHVVDERNYWYVTLRRNNEFSLRRMVDGKVQVIATVPQSVVTGSWYDLRLEIVGVDIRAYVNGDLKISARDSAMTGGGRNAILMYKAAADFYQYIAYQP